MFCEKCGTRVDDGQPFCPNCGNRLSAPAPTAPVNQGFAPAPAARPVRNAPSFGGLLDKFNSLQGNEKIFYGCTCGLLVLNFILSLLDVYSSGSAFPMAYGASWLLVISNILFTLSITFFLLDYFDKFSFKFLWFFIAGSAALILLLFIITWIAGVSVMGYTTSVRLSVGGWFFLIFQAGLTAVSILLLLEKQKKR